jgi:hypothetical protein
MRNVKVGFVGTTAFVAMFAIGGCGSDSSSTSASDGGGAPSGSGSTAKGNGSCVLPEPNLGSCIDYTGNRSVTASFEQDCKTVRGTYSSGACATAGRVGSCKTFGGMATEQTFRFYSPNFTAALAAGRCTALNMFQAPATFTAD